MNLLLLRFILAVTALVALVVTGGCILFFGGALSQTQVVLLTLVIGALIAEAKTSSSWTFDGVAPKDDPATPGTVTTTATETTTKKDTP